MRILYLDLATRTGYAIGPAGEKPRAGAVRLRKPDEPLYVASNNIGYFLKDTCVLERPDLIAYEAPLDPAAKAQMEKNGRPQNSSSIALPWMLVGVVEWFGSLYGIRCETTNRQKVLRHFTGRSHWGGRPQSKKAVIERCHLLGFLPRTSKDDDQADAIAGHDYASAVFGRVRPRELTMFGEAR